MCGRYSLTTPGEVLTETFALPEAPEVEPRYNIAPSQEVPAVRVDPFGGQRELAFLRWGLVPKWAKDEGMGNRLINARAESVDQKPAFEESFERQRCLIPADGFFEWRKNGAQRKPFYLRLRGGEPFAMAGLWARWWSRNRAALETCTVITTAANDLVARIHDRMPVILDPEAWDRWLAVEPDDLRALRELLRPLDPGKMECYPVSPLVNSPANDVPECVEPFADPPPADPPRQGSLF